MALDECNLVEKKDSFPYEFECWMVHWDRYRHYAYAFILMLWRKDILKEENKGPEKEILRGTLQIKRQVIISALFKEHDYNLSLMERGQRSASGISVDLKRGVYC